MYEHVVNGVVQTQKDKEDAGDDGEENGKAWVEGICAAKWFSDAMKSAKVTVQK